MDKTIRVMTEAERQYCYSQSRQLMGQTGCIGHLRADMDTNGDGFFTTWEDESVFLKTDAFKTELNDVINSLRFGGRDAFLSSRDALAKYCRSIPAARISGAEESYGIRVDTDSYAYMMRLNPNRGIYNLYCYCYRRDWLDKHLENAARGIRFIDSNYREKFRIPDGGRICVTWPDGQQRTFLCRYIDDYHTEIGSGGMNLYHICEFAERMEENGNVVEPVLPGLPEHCYSTLPGTGDLVILRRGEKGYHRTDIPVSSREEARSLADEFNGKLGVTKQQEAAMLAGSIHGFHVPAADPRAYDETGNLWMTEEKDRGEAR